MEWAVGLFTWRESQELGVCDMEWKEMQILAHWKVQEYMVKHGLNITQPLQKLCGDGPESLIQSRLDTEGLSCILSGSSQLHCLRWKHKWCWCIVRQYIELMVQWKQRKTRNNCSYCYIMNKVHFWEQGSQSFRIEMWNFLKLNLWNWQSVFQTAINFLKAKYVEIEQECWDCGLINNVEWPEQAWICMDYPF